MKVMGIMVTNEQLVSALGLPEDAVILGGQQNPHTMDFTFTVHSETECSDKPEGHAMICRHMGTVQG